MRQINNIQSQPNRSQSDHHLTHGPSHQHSRPSKLRKHMLRWVYSNAYLAFPILAITFETYMYIGDFNISINYLGFMFFSTLFLYPFHRLIGIYSTPELEYTKAQREVSKRPNLTRISVILGFMGALYFAPQLPFEIISWLLPLGLISLAYSIPFIPTTSGWKRLRDIPGLKIFAITIVVTMTTSTIPLQFSGTVSDLNIWFFDVQRFLFILAITIPFDVRDAHLDKKWNLKTIPLLIGKKNAILLSIILLYSSFAVHVIQYYSTQIFTIEIVFATLLAIVFTHYLIHDFKNKNTYLYNAFLIEGAMVYHTSIITITMILIDLV